MSIDSITRRLTYQTGRTDVGSEGCDSNDLTKICSHIDDGDGFGIEILWHNGDASQDTIEFDV